MTAVADPDEEEKKEESFVPKQAPVSESKRMRRAEMHDRAWIADFWIELLLVLLGLNVGPLLFWYFAQRAPGNSESADFLRTGTGFWDRNLAYLLAPMRYVRGATLRENLPQAWGDGAARYGPLLALCASLLATACMLWSKPAIVQTVKGMAHMRAAPITHVAIAWAWLSDMTPSFRDMSDIFKTSEDALNLFRGMVNWISGPIRMLIGYVIVIIGSHMFAGVAQAGALLFLLFAASGAEKWWETGSFGVVIPDPAAGATSSAGASRGGPVSGGGRAAAAAVFGDDWDDDGVPIADAATANVFGPIVAGGALLPSLASLAGTKLATAKTVTATAKAAATTAMASSASSTIPFVPPSDAAQSGFLDAVNRGAFRANKYTGPLVLAVFAAIKMVGATRMKTRAGSIFAWTASSLVGLASVGTVALRAAPAAPVTVRW